MMRRLLVLLVIVMPCSAQTLVAHIAANSAATSTTTSSINTTTATFEAVCATQGYFFNPSDTVNDSLGNIWTKVYQHDMNPYGIVTLFTSFLPTTGSAQTFTYGGGSGAYTGLSVMAFSGVASGPDRMSGAGLDYGASLASGSITPSNAHELVINCFSTTGQTNISGVSIASPMTLLDNATTAGSNVPSIADAYQIQGGSASAVNPTWSFTTASGNPNANTITLSYYSTAAPAALSITTTGLAEAFHSIAYSATGSIYPICLSALGGVQPYAWSVTSGNLPPGLSLGSSTGCISGTPTTTASAVNVVFKVTDSQPVNTSVTLPMTVAASALTLGAGTCPSTITGTQYQAITSCTLAGAGGTSPLVYSYNNGYTANTYSALPAGVSMGSSSGVISGTDYTAGPGISASNGLMDFILTDSLGSSIHLGTLTYNMTGDYSWLVNASSCGTIFPCDSIFSSQVRLDSLPADTAVYAAFPSAAQGFALSINPWEVFIKVPNATATATVVTATGGYQIMFPPFSLTSNGYGGGTSYGPVPDYQPIEGGSTTGDCSSQGGGNDCHALGVLLNSDGVTINSVWEQYSGGLVSSGNWLDGSNISWSASEYTAETMPAQDVGSVDAAGLPVAAALLTYDQLMAGKAGLIRFTYPQNLNRYVWPATAHGGGLGGCSGTGFIDPNNNIILQNDPPSVCNVGFTPFGGIWRIKASTYVSPPNACLTNASTNPQASRIFTLLRQHGLILADNGGFYPTIAADARWNPTDLSCIANLHISDLEMVNVSSIIKDFAGSSPPLPTVSYKTTVTLPVGGSVIGGSSKFGGTGAH